jgi:hypothetical protein
MTCDEFLGTKGCSHEPPTVAEMSACLSHIQECPACREKVREHSDEVDLHTTQREKDARRAVAVAYFNALSNDPESCIYGECNP